MEIKYIVARFEEELEWLAPIAGDCIIVNKGPPLSNIKPRMIIESENVGRESESYLRYIVNNYENLPDVCVFTQGDISDHIKDSNGIDYLKLIAEQANEFGMSRPRAQCSNPYDKDWGPSWNLRHDGYYLHDNYKNGVHTLFYSWFVRNVSDRYPRLMRIHMNGIFAVRRDQILLRPKQYYERMLNQVNWHSNPIEGHFFERSWYYIFNLPDFVKPHSGISYTVLKAVIDERVKLSGCSHPPSDLTLATS